MFRLVFINGIDDQKRRRIAQTHACAAIVRTTKGLNSEGTGQDITGALQAGWTVVMNVYNWKRQCDRRPHDRRRSRPNVVRR